MNSLILATTLLITQSLTIDLVEYEVETISMEKHQSWHFNAKKISYDRKNLIYSIDIDACIIQMGSYEYIKENLYYDWADLNNVGSSITFKINKEKQKCFMFIKKRMLRREAKKNKKLRFARKAHTIISILFGVDTQSQSSNNRRSYYQQAPRQFKSRKKMKRRYKRKRPKARRIKRVYY